MFEWVNSLREPINGFTHILGGVLSIIALAVLVYKSAAQRKTKHIIAFSIYGLSQVALYTMSALYHSLTVSARGIEIFQQIEHAMIFLLIAGTYTPLCLLVLRGKWGWSLLGINWVLAAAGISLKLTLRNPSQPIIITLFSFFIIMGWLIVVGWKPLVRSLHKNGVRWLVSGGLFYTSGAIIMGIKGFNLGFGFGPHQTWHVFVMLGGFCMFWVMYEYVLPLPK